MADQGREERALATTITSDAASAERVAGAMQVGTRLGDRYRVTRFLGQGGMGAVHAAFDQVLGVEVALKSIARGMTEGALERLRSEVLLAQRVNHPGVCRTYDLEEVEGGWYIKLELIQGEDLARRVKTGRLAIAEVVRIARAILDALGAAHAREVIHCDLKPHNVMIERDTGRVVLMDFGVARTSAANDEVGGTPAYMAPEQARGGAVDARSDLYALGVVLYQLLTGALPARGSAPDVRRERRDVPRWLARAVQQLLADDPALRPQDARAAMNLLRSPHRRRIAIGASAVLLPAAAAATWLALRADPAPWRPEIVEVLPKMDEKADGGAFSPDGRWLAYTCDVRSAAINTLCLQEAGSTELRRLAINGSVELNGWSRDSTAMVAVAWDQAQGVLVPIDGSPQTVVSEHTTWIDDCGGRYAVVENSAPGCPDCSRLVVVESGREPREIVRVPPPWQLWRVRCDPAGQRVVYSRSNNGNDADVFVVDLDGGDPDAVTTDGAYNWDPVFSADGTSVIFSSRRGGPQNLWETRLPHGEPRQLTSGPGADVDPAPSPDGASLVFHVEGTYASHVVAFRGSDRKELTHRVEDTRRPMASPSGDRVAFVNVHESVPAVEVVTVADGEIVRLGDGTDVVFPRDDLVVYATVATPPSLVAVDPDGTRPRVLTPLDGAVRGMWLGEDDRVHLSLERDGAREAWSVAVTGGEPTRDAPAPVSWVLPGPRERRLEVTCDLHACDGAIFPEEHHVRLTSAYWVGEDLVYCDGYHVVRLDLATLASTRLEPDCIEGFSISRDGAIIYGEQVGGKTRRMEIVNFADRR